jgi:hypothetical protein
MPSNDKVICKVYFFLIVSFDQTFLLKEKFGYTDLCFQRPILNQLDIIAACATIAITMASQSQSDAKLIYLVKIW